MSRSTGSSRREPPDGSAPGEATGTGDDRTYLLFAAALERSSADRSAFVAQACAGDRRLRESVAALLAADGRTAILPTLGMGLPPPEEEDEQTPARIGPYRVQAVLGRGGMGVVYRAAHERTRRVVALKTVRAGSPMQLACLRREIHALARLSHPGIVPVVDEGLDAGAPWYAMELMRGRTLAARRPEPREGRRLTRAALVALLTLVRRLCDPLAYIHAEGMVHGDLKPANVFLRRGTRPVLVDFGLASAFPAASRERLEEGPGGGTLSYAAPEQLRGQPLDARADIHALGCVLYELLTGRLAFATVDVLRAIGQGRPRLEPPPPSTLVEGLPEGIDDLVARLLAPEPRERIGHAQDVADHLEDLGAESDEGAVRELRTFLYRSALHGRDALIAPLAAAIQAPGSVTLLAGDSGSGKTRILIAAAAMAEQAGAVVLAASGDPDGAAPLGALRPALRTIVDRSLARGEEEIRRVFGKAGPVLAPFEPAIAALPGVRDVPLAPLPADLAASRRHAALVACFEASGRPVLLVDDLQWLDEMTMAFVTELAGGRSRISVVAACRTDGVPEAAAALATLPGVARLEVAPLAAGDVRRMLEDMLAVRSLPDDVVAAVAAHAEGNPFFVAESLRAAVGAGVLQRDRRGSFRIPEASRLDALGLPGSARELLTRRLEGLAPAAARLAEVASVVGRSVGQPLLHALAGLPDGDALAGTTELLRARVLEETAPGLLRFCHDSLRESAYARIAIERRRAIHRDAAEALASSGDEDRLGEVGRHWELGGERVAARDAYVRAGWRAFRAELNADAVRRFTAYLSLVDAPSVESVRARNGLAWALRRLGRRDELRVQSLLTVDESRAIGDRDREADGLLAMAAGELMEGDLDASTRSIEASREVAVRSGNRLGEWAAAIALGQVAWHRGRRDDAAVHFEAAVAIAEELGDRGRAAQARLQVATVASDLGLLDRSRRILESVLDDLHGSGNHLGEAAAAGNLARILARSGRRDDAKRVAARAKGHLREIADAAGEAILEIDMVAIDMLYGRHEEAESRLSAAGELLVGESVYLAGIALVMAALRVQQGRLDEAAAEAATIEALLDGRADTSGRTRIARSRADLRAELLLLRAQIAAAGGAWDEAVAKGEEARESFVRLGLSARRDSALVVARGLRSRGDLEGARRILELEPQGPEDSPVERMAYEVERGHQALLAGEDALAHLARAELLCPEAAAREAGPAGTALKELRRAMLERSRRSAGGSPE